MILGWLVLLYSRFQCWWGGYHKSVLVYQPHADVGFVVTQCYHCGASIMGVSAKQDDVKQFKRMAKLHSEGKKLVLEQKPPLVTEQPPLAATANSDESYEYQTRWGADRSAQGPLELRKHKTTGKVEWRYNSENWQSGAIPEDIACLF